MNTHRIAGGLLVAVLMLFGASAVGAPQAELWPRWQARDSASSVSIDHSPFNEILARYLRQGDDGINRFAYGEVNDTDRERLDTYIQALVSTPISRCNGKQQLAFWINLYNALTIQVVLTHYPVQSIRDIDLSPGLFPRGPWRAKLVTIEGEAVSLDDIEHRILRPIWKDPRVHYAVNCASLGCPNLLPTAFTAATVDAQLDAAAAGFVNHPRAVQVTGDSVKISSIYQWFRSDFGDSDGALIEHLRRYASPALVRRLADVTRIGGHHYDWALNRP